MIKKIKKSIAVFTTLLLMSSSLNATPLGDVDCAQLAIDVYNDLLDNRLDLTVSQINDIAIKVWDLCDEQNK